MSKYVCNVCGYIYDEIAGDIDSGIAPGTKWEDVPDDWVCPICGAGKSEFEEQSEKSPAAPQKIAVAEEEHELSEMSFGAMSALFSNLAKGSEKQYRMEEAEKFIELSKYYKNLNSKNDNDSFSDMSKITTDNLEKDFSKANAIAKELADRGAQRALLWGEKVTRIVSSILSRYEKNENEFLKGKNIYVCEICGFVYIGNEPPEICPVCKVPNMKIRKIERKAV